MADVYKIKIGEETHNLPFLPLSGGTMSGNISYKGTNSTSEIIKFLNNTADGTGNGIKIGGGGATLIGGGESATETESLVTGGEERMIISNDQAIDFYTFCQNGISGAKHFKMGIDGKFYCGDTDVSLSGHTHTKAQITDFSHSHDYLPLSGGTLTGGLTINPSSGPGAFYVYNADDTYRLTHLWDGNTARLYNIKNDGSAYGVLNLLGTIQIGGNTPLTSNNYSSYALPLSGGTMTGAINTPTNQYHYHGAYGINMNNSDIIGVNSIVMRDASDDANEGIKFYRDATHVDSIWVNNGYLYFNQNMEVTSTGCTGGTNRIVIHSGNIGNYALTSLPSHTHTKAQITDFSHSHDYLPLSGGTMNSGKGITFQGSGGISYKGSQETYQMIGFLDNTTNGYGNGIRVGGGGTVIIGAGESSTNFINGGLITDYNDEILHLMADGAINFYSACDTIGNRKTMTFGSDGVLKVGNNAVSLDGHTHGYWTWNENTIKGVKVNNAGYADGAGRADYLTCHHLNYDQLNNLGDSFLYYGSIESGSDTQGIQIGSGVTKMQLESPLTSQLRFRTNDTGGTDSANWGAWNDVLHSNNYTSYCYTKTEVDTKLAGKSDTGHTHSYLPLSGGSLSGALTFTGTDSSTAWIKFSRQNYNYITFPAGYSLAFGNDVGSANTLYRMTGDAFFPETTNTRTLGTSSLKWSNVYATTFTGDLTGNVTTSSAITFKSTSGLSYKGSVATYPMIQFIDNTADSNGNGIKIGGGGATLIGGGESADQTATLLTSGGNERMIISNDQAIDFYTNCQSGIGAAKSFTMSIDGNIYCGNTAVSLNGHTHSYLPLSGGTLTNSLTLSAGNITVSAGSVSAKNGFFETSDEKLKDIQAPLTTDLEKLSHLRKVYFNFKEDPSKTHIGVIAQDIKELYPEIVNETDEGTLNVDYSKLSVIALDAVDQLNTKCKELEEKLNKVLELLNL